MKIFFAKACLDGNVIVSKSFASFLPSFLPQRTPLSNSFVLNINYFPTTLEMFPAVDLPRSRKGKKHCTLFTGWQVKFRQKSLCLLRFRSILYRFPRLYESNFLPLLHRTLNKWLSSTKLPLWHAPMNLRFCLLNTYETSCSQRWITLTSVNYLRDWILLLSRIPCFPFASGRLRRDFIWTITFHRFKSH